MYKCKPFFRNFPGVKEISADFLCAFFKILCVVAAVAKQNSVFFMHGWVSAILGLCEILLAHENAILWLCYKFCRREIKFGDLWRTFKAAHRVI